jgi:glutathione S-transferase
MIKLYRFGPGLNMIDPSPFALKMDLFLRITNTPFEAIQNAKNLQKAPKGKLPFIDDDGTVVADSLFITNYFGTKHVIDLDDHLNAEQKAQSHFMTHSIEQSLYWCIVYFRWVDDKNWLIIKDTFFGDMPFPLKQIVPSIARKSTIKSLHNQGFGRHTEQEILHIAKTHFESIDLFLVGKKFAFNEELSLVDVILFSFLSQIALCSIESPLKDLLHKYTNVVDYCQRLNDVYPVTSSRG